MLDPLQVGTELTDSSDWDIREYRWESAEGHFGGSGLNLFSRSADISLVLPAYNPGRNLRRTIAQLSEFVATTHDRWEFVFVCDGCTDGAAEMIDIWKPQRATVRLLSYFPNRGKGYAVRQGLLAATAPLRLFTDVDLAYPFADIERVVRRLRAGADVVIASRTHPESMIELPAGALGYVYRRHLQSRLFGMLVRLLLPLSNRDTQAGLKGMRDSAVRRLAPRLSCDGFGFDCELLTACARAGITVEEVPVRVRYDTAASTTNLRSTLRMLKEIWNVRRAWPPDTVVPADEPTSLREAG